MRITGKGSVILEHDVDYSYQPQGKFIRISLVYYIKGSSNQLISLGTFLHKECYVQGMANSILLSNLQTKKIYLHCVTINYQEKLSYAHTNICTAKLSIGIMTLQVDDYQVWHKCIGHMSNRAFKQLLNDTMNFSGTIQVSKKFPSVQAVLKANNHLDPFQNLDHAPKKTLNLSIQISKNSCYNCITSLNVSLFFLMTDWDSCM